MKVLLSIGVLGGVIWVVFAAMSKTSPDAPPPDAISSSEAQPAEKRSDKAAVVSSWTIVDQRLGGVRKFDLNVETLHSDGFTIPLEDSEAASPEVIALPEPLGRSEGKWAQAGAFDLSGFAIGLIGNPFWIDWHPPGAMMEYNAATGGYDILPVYDAARAQESGGYKAPPTRWGWMVGKGKDVLDTRAGGNSVRTK